MKKFLVLLFFFSSFVLAQGDVNQKKEILTEEQVENIIKTEIDLQSEKGYFYDPKGRRDPFKSLLIGKEEKFTEECGEGIICIFWDDINVDGIWKVKGSYVAQVRSKKEDLYLLKEGDLLSDGQITKIDLNCVYFRQKINDPTKIVPYQDVQKCLETSATK